MFVGGLSFHMVARNLLCLGGLHRLCRPTVRRGIKGPRFGGVEHRQLPYKGVEIYELLFKKEKVGRRHLLQQRASVHDHIGTCLTIGPVLGRSGVEELGHHLDCLTDDVLSFNLHLCRLCWKLLALLILGTIRARDARKQCWLLQRVMRLGQLLERLTLNALLNRNDLVQPCHPARSLPSLPQSALRDRGASSCTC